MTQPPCILCRRRPVNFLERTCAWCLGAVRRDLGEVEGLYALLPYELTGHGAAASPPDPTGIRSGHDGLLEALVLLGGGTVGVPTTSRANDRSHFADQLATDPPSVVASLASWEDDWRECLHLGAARITATITGCSLFLRQNLQWAAHKHDAFDEFADDIRKLRIKLQVALRIRLPIEEADVKCPDCGGELRKRWRPPDPCTHALGAHRNGGCDQGGLTDDWYCRNRDCGRIMNVAEHWLAVAQLLADRTEVAV